MKSPRAASATKQVQSRPRGARKAAINARPRWRVMVGSTIALGPGKADLLEAIRDQGSISAGALRLKMSYRRAWKLVQEMNDCFVTPLVATSSWRSGGAALTRAGAEALRLYRRVESESQKATFVSRAKLEGMLKQ